MWPFQTITNIAAGAAAIRRRRYGVVEMRDGQFVAVHFRPWPKLVSLAQVSLGRKFHERSAGNRCWLYYNQPLWHSNFLSLVYVVSSREGSLGSLFGGLCVLDEIARLKQSDALLCVAENERISARLMARWGWERHVPESCLRHYIKRFYGVYPEPARMLAQAGLTPALAGPEGPIRHKANDRLRAGA